MSDKRIEIIEEIRDIIEKYNDFLDVSDTYTKAEEVLDYILGGK